MKDTICASRERKEVLNIKVWKGRKVRKTDESQHQGLVIALATESRRKMLSNIQLPSFKLIVYRGPVLIHYRVFFDQKNLKGVRIVRLDLPDFPCAAFASVQCVKMAALGRSFPTSVLSRR